MHFLKCLSHLWSLRSLYTVISLAKLLLLLIQVELTSLLDAVQETETKMVEMSALNHLMSTHVLQQAQQIELLYEQVWTLAYDYLSGCLFNQVHTWSAPSYFQHFTKRNNAGSSSFLTTSKNWWNKPTLENQDHESTH